MIEKAIRRGRPADPALQQQRREKLLDAAYELLRHKSYRSITIRELADRAGTQSAMIHYYFGGKEDLFLCLLKRIGRQQSDLLRAALDAPDPIKAFIETSLAYFSHNPPVIRLLVDEVLGGDSRLKDAFIEIMPKRMAKMLPQLIEHQQQTGRLRPELDAKWVAFSLISLILMPFIGAPGREQGWNISNDELCDPRWAEHIHRLFTEGVKS